jgi:hypothetical protein
MDLSYGLAGFANLSAPADAGITSGRCRADPPPNAQQAVAAGIFQQALCLVTSSFNSILL